MPDESENTPGVKKKTSISLPLDLRELVDASPLNQNQTIIAALRFYFSNDGARLVELQESILEYERNLSEYKQNIATLEARVQEIPFLRGEIEKLHDHMSDQNDIIKAHMAEMYKKDAQLLQLEEVKQQKESKIILLESEKRELEENGKKRKKRWGIF